MPKSTQWKEEKEKKWQIRWHRLNIWEERLLCQNQHMMKKRQGKKLQIRKHRFSRAIKLKSCQHVQENTKESWMRRDGYMNGWLNKWMINKAVSRKPCSMKDDQESRKHVMMEEMMDYPKRRQVLRMPVWKRSSCPAGVTDRVGSFGTSIFCFVRRKTPCLRLDTVLSLHHKPSSSKILWNMHHAFYRTVNFPDSVSSWGPICV